MVGLAEKTAICHLYHFSISYCDFLWSDWWRKRGLLVP